MEDTQGPPTNEVNITITVVGLSPESANAIAQDFISWLSNQGEQDYWNATDYDNTTFDYNWEPDKEQYTNWVVIRELAGE